MAFQCLLLVCAVSLIVGSGAPAAFAQVDSTGPANVAAADDDQSKAYALEACKRLRNRMKDPGSFTLMQVVAIARQNKDPKKPSDFRGCIHYVASNIFGGREQAWGSYWFNGKELQTYVGGPGDNGWGCLRTKSREKSTDVTSDAVSFLSH